LLIRRAWRRDPTLPTRSLFHSFPPSPPPNRQLAKAETLPPGPCPPPFPLEATTGLPLPHASFSRSPHPPTIGAAASHAPAFISKPANTSVGNTINAARSTASVCLLLRSCSFRSVYPIRRDTAGARRMAPPTRSGLVTCEPAHAMATAFRNRVLRRRRLGALVAADMAALPVPAAAAVAPRAPGESSGSASPSTQHQMIVMATV
jgi:hypothetical protein